MKTKVHLVIPQEVLDEVDHIAGKKKRSLFIAQATKEKLDRERFIRTLEETRGAWTADNHPDLRRPKDMETYLRKARDSFQEMDVFKTLLETIKTPTSPQILLDYSAGLEKNINHFLTSCKDPLPFRIKPFPPQGRSYTGPDDSIHKV